MDDLNQPQNSERRTAIKMIAAGSAAIAFPFVSTPSRANAKRQIVVRDPGGVMHQIFEDILYKPFAKAYGAKVIGVVAAHEPTAQVKTMVETKNYQWDMALLSQAAILFLTIDNIYLEKHELEHEPVISAIRPQFRSPYGVGQNVCSTMLGYRH